LTGDTGRVGTGVGEGAEGFDSDNAAGAKSASAGSGGAGDERGFTVGGPGGNTGGVSMQRGRRAVGIYIGTRVAEKVRDIDRAGGFEHGDAEGVTPGDQRKADGVVAGIKDERESAVDGVNGAGWTGA